MAIKISWKNAAYKSYLLRDLTQNWIVIYFDQVMNHMNFYAIPSIGSWDNVITEIVINTAFNRAIYRVITNLVLIISVSKWFKFCPWVLEILRLQNLSLTQNKRLANPQNDRHFPELAKLCPGHPKLGNRTRLRFL